MPTPVLTVAGCLCLLPAVPPWAALLGGVSLVLVFNRPAPTAAARLSRLLLPVAVVGLGAGTRLDRVLAVGAQGLGYTLVGLLVTFALGWWLGRKLAVPERISTLICAGTGICGGSAIAAIAPVIGAAALETSAALGTVFVLNGVALLLFPPLGAWFGLDAHTYGLWCALAIHDTSSVAGAALAAGPDALSLATTVKLSRALWIVPVALILGLWLARRSAYAPAGRRLPVPWFIGGFIALSALFTALPAWQPAAQGVLTTAQSLLTLTLFLIGTGLDRTALRSLGLRPFLHGLLLWLAMATGTLAAIRAGWIH